VSADGPFLDRDALDRVLIVAPYRRDAEYLGGLLAEYEIDVALSDRDTLPIRLREAAGVLVATHEALTPQVIECVSAHLKSQPAWSEMPIVVLLDRSSPNARIRGELAFHWPRARLLFYERPVSAVELLSGIQSALLVRLRQRDVGDHIDRETELRLELNHRVKNILASVASIFQMTRRGASTLEELSEDFDGRLQALSNVHSAVFQATGESVSMREITDLTFAPYRGRGADRVQTRGPEVRLSGESSTTLALCLHELTTNAIKYGALSTPTGSVIFEWSLDGDQFTICWQELGGPPVVMPERTGYGTRFLRSALSSLFGQRPGIDFNPHGLRCEASGPARKILSNF
jgi:two-component sensor histidine kinase